MNVSDLARSPLMQLVWFLLTFFTAISLTAFWMVLCKWGCPVIEPYSLPWLSKYGGYFFAAVSVLIIARLLTGLDDK